MCAGCVSLECLAVPTHSALKVLVFLSWVAQNNGMLLGISSLLLYSSCPVYQKVWGCLFEDLFKLHCFDGENLSWQKYSLLLWHRVTSISRNFVSL